MCDQCGNEPCTCLREEKDWTRPLFEPPRVRDTYIPLPAGISLEEFGKDLFAAIKFIGGMSGLQEQVALAVHHGHGHKIHGFKARRIDLEKELRTVMNRLTPEEREMIFDRYPWVEPTLKVNP